KPCRHHADDGETLRTPHLILEARLEPVVAHDQRRAERAAARSGDLRLGERDPDRRRVLREHLREEIHDGMLSFELALQYRSLANGLVVARSQHVIDVPAYRLVARVAEQPLGTVVPDPHHTSGVEPDDPVRGVFQDVREFGMRLLEQGRAFGDEGLALSPVLRDLLCHEREVACEVLELVVRLDSEWLYRLAARQTPCGGPDP